MMSSALATKLSQLSEFAEATSTAAGKFTLSIEPGHVEIWLAIRDMGKRFTAADLAEVSGASTGKVEHYLASLIRQGLATSEGMTADKRQIYRVDRQSNTPIVLDDQGRPSNGFYKHHAMWKGIRQLKTFTVTGLWHLVRDYQNVTRTGVKDFTRRLETAGYVIALEGPGREGEVEFLLKPAMNTGPMPPRFCEADLVYDINRRAFFGHGIAREVKL